MRPISQNLLRAQRARSIPGKHILLRLVLSSGATSYTYNASLYTGKLKRIQHTEQPFSQKAQVLVDDTDKAIHSLDLEGYKAVLSYGLITRAGAEWVPTAPLWVVGQDRDSYRDRLEVNFELEGTFDRMAKHKATGVLAWGAADTQTVKTHLSALIEATRGGYTRYPAYTATYDTGYDDDGLIDTFIPADHFRIGRNDSRTSKIKELLGYTEAVARVEDDEEVHFFTPVTSGTTYDAEFSLVPGRDYHSFFNKRFRLRIVSPNRVVFESLNDAGIVQYSGNASDASASLTDMEETETHQVRGVSNAQCTALATARLSKYQMQSDKGSAVLPFPHLGLEVYDYINLLDARAGDNRAGNVGSLTRYYEPGQFNMTFGFGRVPLGVAALQGFRQETGQQLTAANLLPLIDALYSYLEQLLDIVGDKADIAAVNAVLQDLFDDAYFRRVTVFDRLRIPYGADKYESA